MVFCQGHPEYDANSLMKEYKREVGRYIFEDLGEYPRFPENYFNNLNTAVLEEFRDRVTRAKLAGAPPPGSFGAPPNSPIGIRTVPAPVIPACCNAT